MSWTRSKAGPFGDIVRFLRNMFVCGGGGGKRVNGVNVVKNWATDPSNTIGGARPGLKGPTSGKQATVTLAPLSDAALSIETMALAMKTY
jgi:hypothetical protein